MKILFLITTMTLMSATCFSQVRPVIENKLGNPKSKVDDASGFSVNLLYTNITSSINKSTNTFSTKDQSPTTTNETTRSTDSSGFYGVGIGYESNGVGSLGWNASFDYYDRLNKSEIEDDVKLFAVEGNLTYFFTSAIHIYGGLNLAYFDLTAMNSNNRLFNSNPDLGGQIGLGYKVSSFTIRAGYQVIRDNMTAVYTDPSVSLVSDYKSAQQIEGFKSSIGYIF